MQNTSSKRGLDTNGGGDLETPPPLPLKTGGSAVVETNQNLKEKRTGVGGYNSGGAKTGENFLPAQHHPPRPSHAASYQDVSKSRQTTAPRQVQGAGLPAERKTTGINALLKTYQQSATSTNSVGVVTRSSSTQERKPVTATKNKTVTEPEKVYVKGSNTTPRKTNTVSVISEAEPRTTTDRKTTTLTPSSSTEQSRLTDRKTAPSGTTKQSRLVVAPKKSSIEIPKSANAKIQDAVKRLKQKSAVDETDSSRGRTSSTRSSMIRGAGRQGIGALTARFESPKETPKPERTTRRDPIITSKVSDRKEIFNNNGGVGSSGSTSSPGSSRSSSSSSSSRVPLKSTPSRSVLERYMSPTPGKSATLKSKFESKPEADRQPQFLRRPQGQSVSEGDKVKFSCKPSGVPAPSVSWHFKGKILKDEGRYEIYDEKDLHYLEIFDSTMDDAGTYTCKLLNSTGRASATADLKVNGEYSIFSSFPHVYARVKS